MNEIIEDQLILDQIHIIRAEKVMIDYELASLYQVETKQLKRQVRRNIECFPEDFTFELSNDEYDSLRSQIGTLKKGEHAKYLPMAFNENGVSMLSTVLNSGIAIKVNIQIIRLLTKARRMLIDNSAIKVEIENIKKKLTIRTKSGDYFPLP